MRSKFAIYVTFGVLMLSSCAQIVNPTGGERDLTAPEILTTSPRNKSTNFSKNTIQFKFNVVSSTQ